ncbi:hypothetical protein FB45DRAFT_61014, partial [Roridomyces roridus]
CFCPLACHQRYRLTVAPWPLGLSPFHCIHPRALSPHSSTPASYPICYTSSIHMVDTTTAKWLAAAAQRPPEKEPSSTVPYLFEVQDATWSSVYLFGPVGRSFGAFIHRDRQAAQNYILTVTDAHGAPRSVDVCESLRRAGIDLARLQQRAPHPHHHSREAASQYLDFLLWLEAFLYFLLWHGFPSFLHYNLTTELLEYHKAIFKVPAGLPAASSDKLRAEDLWDRRKRHQAMHPGSHVPPGITVAVLATDWADPRSAPCPDKAWAVLDPKLGLTFKLPASSTWAGKMVISKSDTEISLPLLAPTESSRHDITSNDGKRKASSEAGLPVAKRARESPPLSTTTSSDLIAPLSVPSDKSRDVSVSAVTPPVSESVPASRADTAMPAAPKDINTTPGDVSNPTAMLVDVKPSPTEEAPATGDADGTGNGHVAGSSASVEPVAGSAGSGEKIALDSNLSQQPQPASSTPSLQLIHDICGMLDYDVTSLPSSRASSEMPPPPPPSAPISTSTSTPTTTSPPPLNSKPPSSTSSTSGKRARDEEAMPPPPPPSAPRSISASTSASPPSSSSKGKGKAKATSAAKSKVKAPRPRKSKSTGTSRRHAHPPPPPLVRAAEIHAAPNAPRILGSGLVMSFTFDPASRRPFGRETKDGDVQALVEWFKFVEGESRRKRDGGDGVVDDFVWYLEEVLRRAEANSGSTGEGEGGGEDEGRSPFGLVLERVSDEPRAFGDGTVVGDGEDVCRFLIACVGGDCEIQTARRWVRYVRGVLEGAREAL